MLEVKNLRTKFRVGDRFVTAVDDISYTVGEKEVVGLVGESGSGKSVSSLSVINLLPANGLIEQGEVLWNGENILNKSDVEMQAIRGSQIGMIFQNPLSALNPVFTVGNQMIETIVLHQKVSKQEARDIAIDLLRRVKIADPETRIDNYPHEFSLGMCQRVMIALTLAMKPKLIIADEPTASLDVTIQAQILDLLEELKEEFEMSILMISHDLGVIAQHCDKIMVMYLGKVVESGSPEDIFCRPQHPYTQALIGSIPNPDPTVKQKPTLIEGDIPSPLDIPSGCRFHPRCPQAKPECSTQLPKRSGADGHVVECLLYE